MSAFDTEKMLDARRELEAVVEGLPEEGYADAVTYAREAIRHADEALRDPEKSEASLKKASSRAHDLSLMTADGPGNGHAKRAATLLDEVVITVA